MHFWHRTRDRWNGLDRLADPDDDLVGFHACPKCQADLEERERRIDQHLLILKEGDRNQ